MSPSSIARRPLGPGGPLVPPLALGSWNTWDRMDPGEAVEMIRAAVAGGAGFFDVAYYNMGPHAENSRTDILFGQALRASGVARDAVVLCGKLWLWDWPRASFRAQLEESLDRAGLDRFDAVVVGDYLDAPDPQRLVDEVGELMSEGFFDVWGINNWTIGTTTAVIAEAERAGVAGPTFAQLKYSIVRRSMAEGAPYRELFDAGVLALQASDSFEGGVLLGRTPARKIGADVGGIRALIADAAPEVATIAASFDATPAQLAIAYCLAYGPTANLLFGASRLEQLESNLAAARLADEHGAAIRDAVAHLWLDRHVAADGAW